MMQWKSKLLDNISQQLENDSEWKDIIFKTAKERSLGIHLGVFVEPFLSLIFQGDKRIETRFSTNNIAPFGRVCSGDVIVIKEAGGLVKAIFTAGDVWFYSHLNNKRIHEIEEKYGQLICSDCISNFWQSRSKSSFATLIEIKLLKELTPFHIGKQDRAGWSTIQLGYNNTLFKT